MGIGRQSRRTSRLTTGGCLPPLNTVGSGGGGKGGNVAGETQHESVLGGPGAQ